MMAYGLWLMAACLAARAIRYTPSAIGYWWVETIVEAALEGSREKFVQALALDGAVRSLEQAEALAGELIAAHAEYLPWAKPPTTPYERSKEP